MLDENEIKKNIARIICGADEGTAFLISEDLAITAKHCIDSYNENTKIKLEFLNIENKVVEIIAKPLYLELSVSLGVDVVILKLHEPLIKKSEYFKLNRNILSNRASWKTYGYANGDGVFVDGIVREKRENIYNVNDYDLILEYNGPAFETLGLSGAPIFINGEVYGVLTDDKENKNLLGAFSISKIEKLLEKIEFIFEETDNQKKSIKKIIKDYNTIDLIRKSLESKDSGYIFVKGVPGSGKTTLASHLEFEEENIKIIDKYLLKDLNDDNNPMYKASEENFGKYFINSISKFLYNTLIEDKSYNYDELLKLSSNYCSNLSSNILNEETKFIFIIDGIDEVYNFGREKLERFLGILPLNIINNFFIIIFGNNENILPILFRNKLELDNIIEISPFDNIEVIEYIKDNLEIKTIADEEIEKLAQKSEGNPLYLRYLIDYFNMFPEEMSDENIENIPKFNGEINNYYNSFWERVTDDYDLSEILSIISRVRSYISIRDLSKIVRNKLLLENNLKKINHLINNEDGRVSIYHNSFSYYVIKETNLSSQDIHDQISEFCIENTEDIFSIENILYHLLNGKHKNKLKAIELCNQEWIDKCAEKNIHPDFTIVDLKLVLELSLEEEILPETIRILLLLQRLKFRNEKMFRKFSSKISKALYELDRKEAVLNYIIRENVLEDFVTEREAIYFLRKFKQEGFEKEAEILFEVIKNRCRKKYKNPKEGFSIEVFLADVGAVMLFPEYDIKYRLSVIEKLVSNLDTEDEDKENIIQWVYSEVVAYVMWEDERYGDIKTLVEVYGTEITIKFIGFISKCILKYKDIERIFFKKIKNRALLSAIKDLEKLLLEFDVSQDVLCIMALIEDSENIELVEKLISNEIMKDFNLREENKVDFSYESYFDFYNGNIHYGYVNFEEDIDIISHNLSWEQYLISLTKSLGLVKGQCYRAKAGKNKNLFIKLKDQLDIIISKIDFSLKERKEWERSYLIPEKIFPLIYDQVVDIKLTFFENENLEEFLENLLNEYQLGLYNEGYRESLFSIVNKMIYHNVDKKIIFKILEKLENFIENFILNRWERTEKFLEIIELYGKIKCTEAGDKTFLKMLKTSMGPSWYKEAQFNLLGIGINELKNLSNREKYIKTIISHLDYSGGEMTFQRYIRDEKEEFVEIIGRILGIKKGLEYFKFLTLPKPEQLMINVNKIQSDLIQNDMGYIRGTHEIDMQDAMLQFLKLFENIDLRIQYAITELFIQGDNRYFEDYVDMQLKILSKTKENENGEIYFQILEKIKKQFIIKLDEKRKSEYFNRVRKSENSMLELEIDKLYEEKSSVNFEDKNDILYEEKNKDTNIVLEKIKEEIELKNYDKAKEILVRELTKLSTSIDDVFRYSKESTEYLKLLKEITVSGEEFIGKIKELILNIRYTDEWLTVIDVLKLVGEKIDEEKSEKIMNIIIEHINYLTLTPEENIKKFSWIEDEEKDYNEEHEIINFIIWLTNLPEGLIYKNNAIEILVWLSELKPEVMISILFEEALRSETLESNVICANVLHVLSQTEVINSIWPCIYYDKEIQKKILEEKHFIIKSNFLSIVEEAKEKNLFGAAEFFLILQNNFYRKNSKKGDTILNLSYNFSWLNDRNIAKLKFLNEYIDVDKKFLNKLDNIMCEKIKPYSYEQFMKMDEYIKRSYFIHEGIPGHLDFIFEYSLNLIITEYITKENYIPFLTIFRNYNPSSPERRFSLKKDDIFKKIKRILETRENNYTCCFIDDQVILHYNGVEENEKKTHYERIEIVAFLMKKNIDFSEVREELYDSFFSNVLPKEVKINIVEYDKIIPLILKLDLMICYNSMYTPSELHPYIKTNYNITEQDVKKVTWKYGTNMGARRFGMAQSEGCLLTIDKRKFSNFKFEYKLVHLIKYDGRSILIDNDKKRIYEVR